MGFWVMQGSGVRVQGLISGCRVQDLGSLAA